MKHTNKLLCAIIATILPAMYAWAYLSSVERRVSFGSAAATAEYRAGGSLAIAFFMPAHKVDRLLRPGYWTVGGVAADPYDIQTFTK